MDRMARLDATCRAKLVGCYILHHLKLAFGESGPTRVANSNALNFLAIGSAPQGVGLRWKKGDRYTFKTANHVSGQQEDLQADGEMFCGMQPLAHLFVSWTENTDNPLAPSLERIAFTREHDNRVDWCDVVYVATEAPEAIKIDESFEQTQLPFVGKVKVKPIAKPAEQAEGEGEKEAASGTE